MEDEINIKEWIKKVIESCQHTIHLDYAKVLVHIYEDQCGNESDIIEVKDFLNQKYNHIHSIIQ